MINKKPFSASLSQDNITYILDEVEKKKETNSRYNKSHWLDDLVTHLRTKAEAKKPKAEVVVIEPEYPEGLNVIAWNLWVDFRKKAKFKKYKTDSAMKKLAKMGSYDEQLLIVRQSIDNEYQGLFELKNTTYKLRSKTANNLSACEDFINER